MDIAVWILWHGYRGSVSGRGRRQVEDAGLVEDAKLCGEGGLKTRAIRSEWLGKVGAARAQLLKSYFFNFSGGPKVTFF